MNPLFRVCMARSFGAMLVALAALAYVAPAHAALGSPLDVSLIAPGGTTADSTAIDVTDNVSTAIGVHPGDGSQIGGFMLSSESISFAGNSILLHIAAGDVDSGGNLITGYLGSGTDHARYEFSGLDILGETIIGLGLSASGIASPSDPTSFVHLLSPHSLSVDLDSLMFIPNSAGQSFAGGDLQINLLTDVVSGVPEPSSWALMLLALTMMAAVPSLRRRAALRD